MQIQVETIHQLEGQYPLSDEGDFVGKLKARTELSLFKK
jgi:hypothetical protein